MYQFVIIDLLVAVAVHVAVFGPEAKTQNKQQ